MQTRRFFVSIALILAGIAAPRAFAQTALKANIPPAPAGGIDPSKLPDIQGIHLGITPDEALPLIKANYPGPNGTPSKPNIISPIYAGTPTPKWIAYVAVETSNACAAGVVCSTREDINATFTGPPNKGVLVKLVRNIVFNAKQPPTVASIDAALKAKYGANPFMKTPYIYYWAFNEQGGPLVPAPPFKSMDCVGDILAPASNIKSYTASGLPLNQFDLTQWMNIRCNDLGVYVRASVGASPSSPFAFTMELQITDTAEDVRDALAGEAYIEQINAGIQQNMQKNTQQNTPKL